MDDTHQVASPLVNKLGTGWHVTVAFGQWLKVWAQRLDRRPEVIAAARVAKRCCDSWKAAEFEDAALQVMPISFLQERLGWHTTKLLDERIKIGAETFYCRPRFPGHIR